MARARAELELRRREQVRGRIEAHTRLIDLDTVDFVPAVTPKYERPEHLAPLGDFFDRVARGEVVKLLLSAPPQHGKALADDTPIWTQRGWTTVGDVVVGDMLVGADGQWTRVDGVFPQGEVELFDVVFTSGDAVRACGEHRWAVKGRYTERRHVLTTREIARRLKESDGRNRWRVPVVRPAAGTATNLPIDPYVLGAWLGDGSSYKAELTSADPEIVDAFRRAGYSSSYEYARGAATTYGFIGLLTKLRALGVVRNKHVPESYMTAPPEARLAVLQGIADTDGTAAKNGRQQSICTVRPRLARDIKTLVSSLGGHWREYTRPAAGKVAHNIYVRLPKGMSLFRLKRKRERVRATERFDHDGRFIDDVVPVGRGHATCFLVAADDHLFCAGRDLVVTHNSEVMGHGGAKLLAQHPDWPIIYASYGASLAEQRSRAMRDYARAVNVEMRPDADSIGDWLTPQGGGLRARGIGGPTTGNPAKVFIVDDPHKDRVEADSAHMRQKVFDWFTSVADTRCHPDSSILVAHARWDSDDLIGRLSQLTDKRGRKVWEHVNLPAILDDGRPLWHRRPIEWLEPKQAFEHDWWSLWMGRPRDRGERVFKGVYYYDKLPDRFRIGKGIDLAYTAKKRACFSAGVVLVEDEDVVYVVDVRRGQVEAPTFAGDLRSASLVWPGAWHWFASTTERGTAALMREVGVDVEDVLASSDKFDRAQAVAARWNAKKVLVPRTVRATLTAHDPRRETARPEDLDREVPWLKDFIDEVGRFTGVSDLSDDQVDALASANEAVRYRADKPRTVTGSGSRYGGDRGYG